MNWDKELGGKHTKEAYSTVFEKVEQSGDVPAMLELFRHLLNDDKADVQAVKKEVIDAMIERMNLFSFQACVEVSQGLHAILSEHASTYEAQLNTCSECLGTAYLQYRKFDEAIEEFAKIKFDGMSKKFEAHVYVKIAQAELGNSNSDRADMFITKATGLMRQEPSIADDPRISLKYKGCYAQLRDAERKFLIAARHYYGLSQNENMRDKESPLQAACICAIVAPAGPMRNNMLATLYKDERTSRYEKIKGAIFPVLENMYMGKIVREADLADFKSLLKEQHFAQNADGSTVFSRAIMDHNLFSASKLYTNISFSELGTLLGISADEAEATASTMISENRLDGAIIDQVDGFITFPHVEEQLLVWDSHVDLACGVLNGLVDTISSKHPHLVHTS